MTHFMPLNPSKPLSHSMYSCFISLRYFSNQVLRCFESCLCCCFNSVPSTNLSLHKILIIGDDLASGYGDGNLTLFSNEGGLEHYLSTETKGKQQIRQKWLVLNYSKRNSTTKQWLPHHSSGYLQKVLSHSNYGDAEIIVLCLGAHLDNNEDSSRDDYVGTAQNIFTIAEFLANQGKHVHIVTPLCPPAYNSAINPETRSKQVERNTYLVNRVYQYSAELRATRESKENKGNKESVADFSPNSNGAVANLDNSGLDDDPADHFEVKSEEHAVELTPSGGSLQVAVDCFHYQAYHNAKHYIFNMLQLNSQGYQRLAKDLYRSVLATMTKIEWKSWQQLLQQPNSSKINKYKVKNQ
jgi:hypothetical protein